MSRDIWVNRCRDKIPSRFLLAQAAVLRWEQLLRGARPRIETERPRHMETPLEELATGAVELNYETLQVELCGTPYEPPRPEPEEEILGELEELMASVPAIPTPTVATATRTAEATTTVEDVPTVEVEENTPATTGTGGPA